MSILVLSQMASLFSKCQSEQSLSEERDHADSLKIIYSPESLQDNTGQPCLEPPGKTRSQDSGFPPQAPWVTFPILSQGRHCNFPSQGTQDTVILVLRRALVSPGPCDRGGNLRVPEPGGPTDNLVCALPS